MVLIVPKDRDLRARGGCSVPVAVTVHHSLQMNSMQFNYKHSKAMSVVNTPQPHQALLLVCMCLIVM